MGSGKLPLKPGQTAGILGLGVSGGYYELLIALLETAADGMGLEMLKIYTDREFLSAIASGGAADGAADERENK